MNSKDVTLSVDDIMKISRVKTQKPSFENTNVIHSRNKRSIIESILTKASNGSNIRGLDKYLIHYETGSDGQSRQGHWVSLIIDYNKKEALFMDPMGMFPDNELNLISNEVRANSDQLDRSIGKLLYDLSQLGYKIYYNEIKFQTTGSNTCGRYAAAMFLLNRSKIIQPQEFKKILDGYGAEHNLKGYDNIIISMT